MMEKNRPMQSQDDFSMDQFAHEMEQQLLARRNHQAQVHSDLKSTNASFVAQATPLQDVEVNLEKDLLDESFLNELDGWSQSAIKKRADHQSASEAKQIEFRLQEIEFVEPSVIAQSNSDELVHVTEETHSETAHDMMAEAEAEFTADTVAGLDLPNDVIKSAAFPVSLPAALCDESLLSEIASIPQKMGFKIGEVADMLGIKQYVLRYWESEFDVLKPKKAPNNQRLYTRRDVENAYIIRKLLHRDRFSIEGARHAMKELKGQVRKEKNWTTVVNKIEKIEDKVTDFAIEVRKIKLLFK